MLIVKIFPEKGNVSTFFHRLERQCCSKAEYEIQEKVWLICIEGVRSIESQFYFRFCPYCGEKIEIDKARRD